MLHSPHLSKIQSNSSWLAINFSPRSFICLIPLLTAGCLPPCFISFYFIYSSLLKKISSNTLIGWIPSLPPRCSHLFIFCVLYNTSHSPLLPPPPPLPPSSRNERKEGEKSLRRWVNKRVLICSPALHLPNWMSPCSNCGDHDQSIGLERPSHPAFLYFSLLCSSFSTPSSFSFF